MRIGLATLAAGRSRHLERQAAAVARLTGVARYVIVAMDPEPPSVPDAEVLQLPTGGRGLPLAAARNRAIAALEDCELVVLLDVDCLPSAELVTRYASAASELGAQPALLCGPVGYLDALPDIAPEPSVAQLRTARGRVIRSFPAAGIRREPRAELFWSLSCAVAPQVHEAIGGFDEGYRGWGAEDTDYGLRAAAAGVALWFVAGAWAYHQHHSPAPGDLGELTANARRFRERWGFWPMPDRLGHLAEQGRIDWAPGGDRCEAVPIATPDPSD